MVGRRVAGEAVLEFTAEVWEGVAEEKRLGTERRRGSVLLEEAPDSCPSPLVGFLPPLPRLSARQYYWKRAAL